jgi:hypothetical protein
VARLNEGAGLEHMKSITVGIPHVSIIAAAATIARYCSAVAMIILLVSGCASVPGRQVADAVRPEMVPNELHPDELLDVSIVVFDPGKLPDDEDERIGLSPEIRAAEARFVPTHLKYTMQQSGYWGTVRVIPRADVGSDVLVTGRIDYSDGESMVLTIEAYDSRGRQWFKKDYAETSKSHEHTGIEPQKTDVFQDLFTTIANDLVNARNQLRYDEIRNIKLIARQQFASSMAPEAFAGYLVKDDQGYWQLVRLPAENDPMMERIEAVRSRDDMLVDIINGHYDAYYRDLWQPYSEWRRSRRDEVAAMRKLEREALGRQLLGIAAIVGGIAIGMDSDNIDRSGVLTDVLILGGAAAVYSGFEKRKETEINKDVIAELGESFQSEASPLLLEVQGETIRLTGTAEERYGQWRKILREIHFQETGMTPVSQSEQVTPQ